MCAMRQRHECEITGGGHGSRNGEAPPSIMQHTHAQSMCGLRLNALNFERYQRARAQILIL